MGANRPTRNHYIPEMLIKNFCDDSGLLWVGDQKRGKCYQANPTNVFVKNKLYVKHDYSQATDSYEYEGSLSKIESEAEPTISSLIEQARCRRNPCLNPELNNHFKKFVMALARRTPESQESVLSEVDMDFGEVFDSVAAGLLRKAGYDVPEKEWTAPGLLDTRVRVFDLMRPPQLERVFPALPGPAFGSRSPRESNDGYTGS